MRTAATLHSAHLFTLCDAGVNMWCGGTPGQFGGATISGALSIGSGLGDGDFWNGYGGSLNDDISWVKGAHQMTFGFGFWQGRVDEFNHFASSGNQVQFLGSSTGLGLSTFCWEMSRHSAPRPAKTVTPRARSIDLFLPDTWKITPRLTFNFGLRWEPFLPQTITYGQLLPNFEMSRFLAGTSAVLERALPDFTSRAIPDSPISRPPTGSGCISIRAEVWLGCRRAMARLPFERRMRFVTPTCLALRTKTREGRDPWGGRWHCRARWADWLVPGKRNQVGIHILTPITPDVKFTAGGHT